jgi:GntR family transcriptional repressor for pyruvate dehydrogenase complex
VSRESLSDDLSGHLLQAVIDGRHRPDALLPPEAELAEEAGVSRLTVREAIKTLRAKNVVRVERGRGTFVNPPSRWTDLEALLHAAAASRSTPDGLAPRRLIEARRVIEVGAAELAATRRGADHLDTLEAEVARMRAGADAGDVDAFVAADIAFHAAVLDAAGNVFLAALYDPLRQLLLTARRQTSAYEEIRRHAIEQHEAVLAAIRDGSAERAAQSMRGHMDQTERDLDTYVLGSGG